MPVFQDDFPFGILGYIWLVSDENDRDTRSFQLLKQGHHVHACARVEGLCRLIGQNDARIQSSWPAR